MEAPFTKILDVPSYWLPALGRALEPVWAHHFDSFTALQNHLPSTLPCAIFHAVDDWIVPFALGQRLAESQKHVHFIPALDGGHVGIFQEDSILARYHAFLCHAAIMKCESTVLLDK